MITKEVLEKNNVKDFRGTKEIKLTSTAFEEILEGLEFLNKHSRCLVNDENYNNFARDVYAKIIRELKK